MKKIILLFVIIMAFTGLVAADGIVVCIDTIPPEAPTSLAYTGNVELTWDEAIDLPEPYEGCPFGIDYYEIYKDGEKVGTSSDTSFTEGPLADGTYLYEVFAVDKAENEGAIAELVVTIGDSGDNPPPGGGPSGGSNRKKCNDNRDNDGDGLIDLDDPGCEDKYDNDETNIVEEEPAEEEQPEEEVVEETPLEEQPEETEPVEESQQGNWFTNLITGQAFRGAGEGSAWIGLILALVIIALVLVFTVFKKKKP